MQWVEGLLLNQFVREHLDQPQALETLGQLWAKLAGRLRGAGVAHGDLQHGNVLLVPGSRVGALAVRLIDYDGLWVPALADTPSGEVGHPAYQHPQRLRAGTYSPEVDRFPLLVVYAALRCLAVGGRALWDRFDNGDNLLFRKQDFEAPARSALFANLLRMNHPAVRGLAAALIDAARMPLDQAPLLEQLVPGGAAPQPAAEARSESRPAAPVGPVAAPAAPPRGRGQRTAGRRVARWALAGGAAAVLCCLGLVALAFLGPRGGVATPSPVARGSTPQEAAGPTTKRVGDVPTTLPGPRPSPVPSGPAAKAKTSPGPDSRAAKEKTNAGPAKQVRPITEPGGEPRPKPKPEPAIAPKPERVGEVLRIDLIEGGWWLNPQAFSINSDGRRAVGCTAKGLELLDLDTGETLKHLALKVRVTPVDAIPRWASFLRGDREILLSFNGGALEILTPETGVRRPMVQVAEPPLAVSRDGRTVFACGSDHAIRQFDAATGKELARSGSLDFSPSHLSPSADGRRALMCADGRRVYVWDTAMGGKRRSIRSLAIPNDEGESYEQLALSPDGRRAVLSRGYTKLRHILFVWDVDADREIRRIELPQVCRHLAFTPDGKSVLAASCGYLPNASRTAAMSRARGSSPLWLLDLETGNTLHKFEGHSNEGIVYLGVSADGRRAVTVGGDRTMRVWGLPARSDRHAK
jgi:hypothetical protein